MCACVCVCVCVCVCACACACVCVNVLIYSTGLLVVFDVFKCFIGSSDRVVFLHITRFPASYIDVIYMHIFFDNIYISPTYRPHHLGALFWYRACLS